MSMLLFKVILSLMLDVKSEEKKNVSCSWIRKSPRATVGVTDKGF